VIFVKGNIPKKNIVSKKNGVNDTLLKKSDKIKNVNAGTILKNEFKSINPQGNISVGYEYGILPFVADNTRPTGGFKSEGVISISAFSIPLDVIYFYTSIKNTVGLNNYFRVSYNADRYKDQMSKKLNDETNINYKKLDKLQLQQQKNLQKIEYLKLLQGSQVYDKSVIKQDYLHQDSINEQHKGYNSNFNNPMSETDTVGKKDSILNTYKNKYYPKTNSEKKDSVTNELNTWKGKYDSINEEIIKVRSIIASSKSLQENPTQLSNPYLSKTDQFLSHIKKFEIGLCNPSYSTFLISNMPLQGINVEYVKSNNFLGISYGTTVNNLLYDPNSLHGMLQGVRNLYNYFDFSNLSVGRKIVVLKGGPGMIENSHFHIGIQIGKGQAGYVYAFPEAASADHKESNLVLEVDAKYKFSEALNVDLIIGKSSVKDGDLSSNLLNNAFTEVASTYRSYAALFRVNTGIKKTNTKVSGTVRWIDPFFKSFGVGFLRTDNIRYEIKADQPINKKIRYSITYRHESDNLLNLYAYKNKLQSINNTLSVKLNRKLNFRFNYTPLFRELKIGEVITKDRNHIFGAVVSYLPKFKKANVQFNGIYCKNIVTADSLNINYESLTYSHQLQFNSGVGNGVNISWFRNNLSDTLGNDIYFFTSNISYSTRKQNKFSIGGKLALSKKTFPQYGFSIKLGIRIYKGIYWETEGEKIIIGEYYNSFMVEQMKKFPYYCSTRLILNF
jgi:hypothetical protein